MELKDALKYIVINKGKDVFSDPKALKSLLLDLAPDDSKDISILYHACGDHYFDNLASCSKEQIPGEIRMSVFRMKESFAESAVERIGTALHYAFDLPEEASSEKAENKTSRATDQTETKASKQTEYVTENIDKAEKKETVRIETKSEPLSGKPSMDTREKFSWWKDLYLYEKAMILTALVSAVLMSVINGDKNPEFVLDYVVNGLMYIPLILSFGVTKKKAAQSKPHGVLLTIIVLGLVITLVMETMHTAELLEALRIQSSATAHQMFLWQQHLALENLILLPALILLAVQMIRHRILEKKS